MKIVNWLACIYWFITAAMLCFGYEPLPGVFISACLLSGMFFLHFATRGSRN
ncbi:hypothetical protein [Bacillus pseudomycoides]|uniref:hypothetical protein n=1 Tax=Bacillus pseudomycoides TaxID=64104 RepID=UPI001596BEBA|nr:hypothetical protein [Bacillus pseudomycoides]